jgi:hypothetical protein
MAKGKRKLTAAERARKRLMRERYEWVFINGKQKRVRRPPLVEGMPVEEFIRRNADPIWLVQDGMYEELDACQKQEDDLANGESAATDGQPNEDDYIPF